MSAKTIAPDPDDAGAPPSRSGRAPTARDVAQAAGVSVAVVSYAFSRPERVAAATRERVLATAAACGYAGPDPAARALRLGRHGAVALVGPGSAEALLADPATALVARGLARACDRAGVALVLTGAAAGAVDGAVLLGGGDWRGGVPVVAVGWSAPAPVPRVVARVAEGAAAAAEHLASLGHRRLGVLRPPEAGERLEGAVRGWGGAGPLVVYEAAGPARADGEVAARAALTARPRPTALLALTDPLALGALDAARLLGLQVPRDLSVAGLDDLPGSAAAGLTSVFVPYLPMGELAGALLAAMLAGAPQPPAPALPTSLAIRATTGPAPAD
jgi:DNA-binding LacI/PurR family transcriptional regulator